MAHVGVVFGGRSVEHQVSIRSARTVVQGLRNAGHTVTPLGIAEDGCWIDAEASEAVISSEATRTIPAVGVPVAPTVRHLLASGVEVVFPIVHGTWGEDGTFQGLCEMLDLAYVGAGVTASALAMDKVLCKRQLAAAGVPVVEFETATRRQFEATPAEILASCLLLEFPLFVKPSVGGSSVGVRKVTNGADLEAAIRFAFSFDDVVLVERGVVGRELECAVLGYREIAASAVGEIIPGNDFYDYADKYLQDTAGLVAPAELPEAVASRLRKMAVEAFTAIGGVGFARVDFLLEGETEEGLFVNEINTLPGFTSISMYPRLWSISGLSLPGLVDRLVQVALDRHRDRRRLDDGIKEFLAELSLKA
ncbi:MAG TPA: D-alanine--D-alanine ligase family protein [Thermoanaerobaculia bacterium]|nr:D-alanine--D-alanine ligase family protein [Thermoanaerobaculia bacterium]